MWTASHGVDCVAPPKPESLESFGMLHHHVTLTGPQVDASQILPYSDLLLSKVVSKWVQKHPLLPAAEVCISSHTDTVDAAAVCARSCALVVVSSSSSSSPTADVAPDSVALPYAGKEMSVSEQDLLSFFMQVDETMRSLVSGQQWALAASRWNTGVTQWINSPKLSRDARHTLHLVHGDLIRRTMDTIARQFSLSERQPATGLATCTTPASVSH